METTPLFCARMASINSFLLVLSWSRRALVLLLHRNNHNKLACIPHVPKVRPGVLLTAHHSRDTAAKQWSETRDLALQGLNRLLRTAATSQAAPSFLAIAPSSTSSGAAVAAMSGPAPWFEEVWRGSLELAVGASLQGSNEQEAALAGIGLLVGMCKLSGIVWMPQDPIKYSNVMRVVDGALVSVDTTSTAKDRKKKHDSSGSGSSNSGTSESSSSSSENAASAAGSSHKEGWIGGPNAWHQSWTSLQRGCGFEVDDEGEVANKALEGLTQLFGQCKDYEFASPDRVVELVELVGSLLWPRYAHPSSYGPRGRAPFRFPVCKAQKVGLALLRTIALHLNRAKTVNTGIASDQTSSSSSSSNAKKLTGFQAKIAQAAGQDLQVQSSHEEGEEKVWVALVGVLGHCAAPPHVAAARAGGGSSNSGAATAGNLSSSPHNKLHAKFSALAADALNALFHRFTLSEEPLPSRLPNQLRLSYIPSAITSESASTSSSDPPSAANAVSAVNNDAAKSTLNSNSKPNEASKEQGKDDDDDDVRMPPRAAAPAYATATSALAPALSQPPLPPPGLQATAVQTRTLQAKAPLKQVVFLKPFLAAEVVKSAPSNTGGGGSGGGKVKVSLASGADGNSSTSVTHWSLRPPLLRSPEAATRWLAALLTSNSDHTSPSPSPLSSSQGATSTAMALCESAQSMAGLPLAARSFVAIAKPSLCAAALREEEAQRRTTSEAGTSDAHLAGNTNMMSSSMSPAVAAALRKTRGALWVQEACEPTVAGDDEALLPCQQVWCI